MKSTSTNPGLYVWSKRLSQWVWLGYNIRARWIWRVLNACTAIVKENH